MRKTGFTLMLGILLLLGLTACAGNGGEPSSSPSVESSISPVPSSSPVASIEPSPSPDIAIPTETPATTPTKVPSSSTVVYINYQFGFQLQIPTSWEGLYEVSEGENSVTFIDIKNKEAGYGGILFTVLISEEEPSELPNYQMFSYLENRYMGITLPTDVQFDGSNQALSQEYQTMAKDIDLIKETATALPR